MVSIFVYVVYVRVKSPYLMTFPGSKNRARAKGFDGEQDDGDDDVEVIEDELYCAACSKIFKSDRQVCDSSMFTCNF